ncbi:MAG: hypothetical protein COA45_11755 [Zetaproteobacteria bacterium]|nr:MAG: hypothetical protein COA45_11755 [Zetaproteobacteria bacterium]
MRSFILTIFFVCIYLCHASISSFAQDAPPAVTQSSSEKSVAPPPTKEASIYDDATDDQIAEAQQYYNHCSNNETVSKQKDCKCATVAYLRTRLELGPDATTKTIMATNRNTCLKDEARHKLSKDRSTRDLSYITEKQLAEAEFVFQHCKAKRALNSQFDCECFAARFLDERLKLGPIPKWESLFGRFNSDCRNVVETTGIEYSTCMMHFGIKDAVNMEPKEYCECYARKWADLFENYPGKITFNTKQSLKSQARGHCKDLDRFR